MLPQHAAPHRAARLVWLSGRPARAGVEATLAARSASSSGPRNSARASNLCSRYKKSKPRHRQTVKPAPRNAVGLARNRLTE